MRTSKWLLVVAGITLLDLAWSIAGWVLGDALLGSGPFAVASFALVGFLVFLLAPVFFAALYLDAGRVRASTSPWTPDRRLWVGGGVAVCAAAYALLHSNVVGFVGLAYLFRRLRHPARVTVDGESDERAWEGSEDRSLAGVAVHLFAVPTSVLGAGLVYATSADDFARENARHALNWHLSVVALTLGSHLLVALGATDGWFLLFDVSGPVVPAPLNVVAFFVGAVLLLAAVVSWGLTVVFAVVAAVKAGRGSPWPYPLAYDFVGQHT